MTGLVALAWAAGAGYVIAHVEFAVKSIRQARREAKAAVAHARAKAAARQR